MADSSSMLLSLPPELRNRIWELVIQPSEVVISLRFQYTACARRPSILQVNQQTRAETLPMYQGQAFMIKREGVLDNLQAVREWLQSIGGRGSRAHAGGAS